VSPQPAETTLDPVIHSQARLRIMTTLCALPTGDRLTFPRLQSLLDATAGNLSTHLRRLEDADYVVVTKGFAGRVPRTEVEATTTGRRAFDDYVTALRALLTPPDVEADGTAGTTTSSGAAGGHADTTSTSRTRAATTARTTTTTTSTEGDA
jgi:DNA-binding HxlR family transcriptional regulator